MAAADPSRRALRATLFEALRSAGEIQLRHFGKAAVRYKGRANLVTQADLASERSILDLLLKRFPDHDYCTEESPPKRSGSSYTWIIDPLDGTTNYAHGYPMFCVSVGLLFRDRPLLGGVFDPFRRELFWAEDGRGARLNGRPIHVSGTRSLRRSLLVTGFPYDRSRRSRFYMEFYRTFMRLSHDVRRSGSAALDLAWVAAGRADAFWEFRLNPWDVAAGWLLVREAGGRVTDFTGRDWASPLELGIRTLATNGLIHEQMIRALRAPRLWRGKEALAIGTREPF